MDLKIAYIFVSSKLESVGSDRNLKNLQGSYLAWTELAPTEPLAALSEKIVEPPPALDVDGPRNGNNGPAINYVFLPRTCAGALTKRRVRRARQLAVP
jgi:hypothetical protein